MTFFKELRELFLMFRDQGMVNDEEFLLLFDLYESKNPDFTYDSYPVFDLQEIDEAECVANVSCTGYSTFCWQAANPTELYW